MTVEHVFCDTCDWQAYASLCSPDDFDLVTEAHDVATPRCPGGFEV